MYPYAVFEVELFDLKLSSVGFMTIEEVEPNCYIPSENLIAVKTIPNNLTMMTETI